MTFDCIKSVVASPHAFSIVLMLILSGCSHYQPRLLTEETIRSQLKTPSFEQLSVQAAKIKHPLLKPVTFNLQDGLSPNEAAILAVLRNPLLRAQRDQKGIVRAQLLQAGILPNPQLSSTFSMPTGGTTSGTNNAFDIGLSWEVTSLIWRQSKIASADKNVSAIDLNIAWQEWQFAQAAKQACYQLIVYQQQLALIKEMNIRLKENQHIMQEAADKGLVTELERVTAISAKNLVENRLLAIEQKMNQQRQLLNYAVGLSPDEHIELQRQIELSTRQKIPMYTELVRDIGKSRLDLVALKRGYESQEERLHMSILQQFPKINIGFNQAKDNSNLNTLGFGVAMDIPVFDRNQGQIALERATRQQLFDQYSARLFQAKADVGNLLISHGSLIKQIEAVTHAIPDSAQLLNAYQSAIRTGQVDVLNYYTTWNTLTEQRIQLLSLKLELIQVEIALEVASGRYLLSKDHHGDRH